MQENSPVLFPTLLSEIAQSLDLTCPIKDQLPGMPKFTPEPTKAELDDLDTLLSESLAIKHKKPARVQYERVRDATGMPSITWKELEAVAMWQRTTCCCGETGPTTFVKFMVKKVGGGITHWQKSDTEPTSIPLRHTLKTNHTKMCELCCEICPNEMEDCANAFC